MRLRSSPVQLLLPDVRQRVDNLPGRKRTADLTLAREVVGRRHRQFRQRRPRHHRHEHRIAVLRPPIVRHRERNVVLTDRKRHFTLRLRPHGQDARPFRQRPAIPDDLPIRVIAAAPVQQHELGAVVILVHNNLIRPGIGHRRLVLGHDRPIHRDHQLVTLERQRTQCQDKHQRVATRPFVNMHDVRPFPHATIPEVPAELNVAWQTGSPINTNDARLESQGCRPPRTGRRARDLDLRQHGDLRRSAARLANLVVNGQVDSVQPRVNKGVVSLARADSVAGAKVPLVRHDVPKRRHAARGTELDGRRRDCDRRGRIYARDWPVQNEVVVRKLVKIQQARRPRRIVPTTDQREQACRCAKQKPAAEVGGSAHEPLLSHTELSVPCLSIYFRKSRLSGQTERPVAHRAVLSHLSAWHRVGSVIGLRIYDTCVFFKNHPYALGAPPAANHYPAPARGSALWCHYPPVRLGVPELLGLPSDAAGNGAATVRSRHVADAAAPQAPAGSVPHRPECNTYSVSLTPDGAAPV